MHYCKERYRIAIYANAVGLSVEASVRLYISFLVFLSQLAWNTRQATDDRLLCFTFRATIETDKEDWTRLH